MDTLANAGAYAMFDFTGTLPGPINWAFAAAIALTTILAYRSGDKRSRIGGHVLIISLAAAWIATYIGINLVITAFLSAVMGLCAVLCLRAGQCGLTAVAALYGIRIAILTAFQIGWINESVMWAWTEIPLILQILIVIGVAANGGLRLNNRADRRNGDRGVRSAAVGVSARLPGRSHRKSSLGHH